MKNIRISEISNGDTDLIEIVKAEYKDQLRLHLWFSDGVETIVDFKPFIDKARHPLFRKYRDVNEFRKFRILYGNLNWNDYEMCFPIADLYEGKI